MQLDTGIIELCKKRFSELDTYRLVLPFACVSAIEQLKSMAREGKEERLNKLGLPEIKIRTVFDHTMSLTFDAAALLQFEQDIDKEILSYLIVYHDVNEIVIGDIPEYTKKPIESIERRRLEQAGKEKRERAANNFLWLFGDENHKKAFEALNSTSREKSFLRVLDKIDPIIAVWRYMRVYNFLLKDRAQSYIETMSDFFTYPVLLALLHSSPNAMLSSVLKILCDKKAALNYLKNSDLTALTYDEEVRAMLIYLVEKTPLFF